MDEFAAETMVPDFPAIHSHVFLGEGHEHAERRTWAVIVLCGAMMVLEIVGGALFGSIALIADGLHMSTHAGAMLLAAIAYSYSRRHADDPRFTFGTGKLGDLAGFTSAIILAMIAVLIGYEAVTRFLAPVPIRFAEAIPIACLGLVVNIASAWLLSGGGHHHHHHQWPRTSAWPGREPRTRGGGAPYPDPERDVGAVGVRGGPSSGLQGADGARTASACGGCHNRNQPAGRRPPGLRHG